jgi:hypothetical protein
MTEVDVMLAFQAYDEIEATGDEELRAHWDALSAAVREGRPKPGASLTRLTEYVNSYAEAYEGWCRLRGREPQSVESLRAYRDRPRV